MVESRSAEKVEIVGGPIITNSDKLFSRPLDGSKIKQIKPVSRYSHDYTLTVPSLCLLHRENGSIL